MQKNRTELEKRVAQRTAELEKTNERLRREINARMKYQNIELDRSRTELKKATVRLEKKNVELKLSVNRAQQSDRMKSEFLANMSHELRTPLNHIVGFTELVLGKQFGDLSDIQQEYLEDVLQSSKYLQSLIDDILNFSVMETGKLIIEISDVNIRMLIENSLNMFKEKANRHGITLSLEMDTILGTIKADERKLKQVMDNLLSNAVKFTPDGGVVNVSVQYVERFVRPGRRSEDPESYQVILDSMQTEGPKSSNFIKCIEFAISDTGIGIGSEDKERIFYRFEQLDSSIRKKYKGTGLGLALCKYIVELHWGRIWAESEGVDKGSTFRFVIPT